MILLERKDGITLAKKYGLVLTVTVILLITAFFKWGYQVNAEGDLEGPVIDIVSPQPESTVNASEQQKVKLNFYDSAGLDTNITLQLDGQNITPEIIWNQSSQTADSTVSEGAYTVAESTYENSVREDHTKGSIMAALPELNPGEHSIYYSVKDSVGNVTENNYVFIADDEEAPVIKNCYPPGSSIIKLATPTIAIRLDEASKIVSESVYLDGSEVQATYNNIHSTIRFAVTQPLSEGIHTIRLVVTDDYGNKTDTEWSFNVDLTDTVIPEPGDNSTTSDLTDNSGTSDSVVSSEDAVTSDFAVTLDGAVSLAAIAPETVTMSATVLSISGSGPVVSDLFPAPGSQIENAAPLFSLRFNDPDKINSSIVIKVDNQSVTPTIKYDDIYELRYDSCTGQPYYVWVGRDLTKGTVTAQFPSLTVGEHTVYYNLKDSLGNVSENSYTFTKIADTGIPQITEQSPANGTVIANPKSEVKVKIVDLSPIDAATVKMKLNGTPVPAVYNGIKDYLTYMPPQPLKNGTYSVEVTAADIFGNTAFSGWSFSINDITPPTISNFVPANSSSVASTTPIIEASLADPSGITNPVYLQIDGNTIEAEYKTQTGKVSYMPLTSMSEGQHTVNMSVYDLQGNRAMKSTVFKIDISGPSITELIPAPESVVESMRPVFSLRFSDPSLINVNYIVKVDDQAIVSQLAFDGIYETRYDSCTGEPYQVHVGTDRTKGTIKAQLAQLSLGQHTIYYNMRDLLGNVTEGSYVFTVSDKQGPRIAEMAPAEGAIIDSAKPAISAKLTDANLIVAESVYLSLNGERVAGNYDNNTKTISYQPVQLLRNGENTVQVYAADELGNSSTNSWTFTVKDTVPPQYSLQTPASGAIVSDGKPLVSVKLTDKNGLTPSSVVMKFNGETVGTFDPATSIISYKPIYGLAVGTYTVQVSASDSLGNLGSTSWSFTVKDAGLPQISNLMPAPGIGTREVRPSISAYVLDSEGIDTGKITLSVDSVPLSTTFKPDISGSVVSGTVYAAPTFDLSSAMHTAVLTVFDRSGNSKQQSWQFGVNIATNMEDCTVCHVEGLSSLEEKHIAGSSNCSQCHGKGLAYAHGPSDPTFYNCARCHDGHLLGIPLPLEGFACTQCHNSTFWDAVPTHGSPAEVSKHDYPELNQECLKCHSTNLTTAHTIGSAESGETSNCLVCHQSSDPKVKAAINESNVACSACHNVEVSHTDLHRSGIDQNCIKCHAENLVDDHITNRPELNFSCNKCHNDTYASVTDSVYGQSDSMLCSRCHTEGHGLKFTAVVPTDIPLYPDQVWTPPIDSRIFNEPWMPSEFATGAKLLISKRQLNISGEEVWQFYNEQMTSLGWTLNSSPPAQSNFFDITFTKLSRKVRVSFYGGENHTASPLVSTGYRIEILYK